MDVTSWRYVAAVCTYGGTVDTEAAAQANLIAEYTSPSNCSLNVQPAGGWYMGGPFTVTGCGTSNTYPQLPLIHPNTGLETLNWRPYSVAVTSPLPACNTSQNNTGYIRKDRDIVCPLGMTFDTYGTVVVNGVTYSAMYCRGAGRNLQKNLGCTDNCTNSGDGGKVLLGNPFNIATSNKYQVEQDYAGSGDGLSFTRHYNSGGQTNTTANAYFGTPWFTQVGRYWRHTYDRSLEVMVSHVMTTVQAYRPDGRIVHFNLNAGVYYPDKDVADKLVALPSNTGYTLTTADDSVETYDPNGVLVSLRSRSGIVQTLTYSTVSTPTSIAPFAGLLINVTDSFGRQLNFTYNAAGRMVTMQDPAGGLYQYAYDSAGNLTTRTAPDTTVKTYVYNEPANVGGTPEPNGLTGIIDENNSRFATYQYNSVGQLVSSSHAGGVNSWSATYASNSSTVTDPLGVARTFFFSNVWGVAKNTSVSSFCAHCGTVAASTGYDANGNINSRTDFKGVQTTYVFDLTRNLETSRTEAVGTPKARTITTSWHATFRRPTQIVEPNRTTTFTHDPNGNVLTRTVTDTSIVPNVVRTWTYTYNSFGKVLTINGPRTDVTDLTTFVYYNCTTGTQCGQVQTMTNAANQVTTYNSYNAHGQPTQITDPNGVVTTLLYDTRQRLTDSCVNGLLPLCTGGDLTHIEYYPTGLLKKVTNPDGSFILNTYDNAHRLTQIQDGPGNRITYTLDNLGNRTGESQFDPTNVLTRTRTQVYNTLGQLWKQIGAAGTVNVTTVFGYDLNGNQNAINAPLGRNTSQLYDEHNRLSQITDPATGVTVFGYDANDNLTSVQDPRTLTTSYTYTGHGDLKTQTSPDTGLTTNTYDSGGNLKTSTDARNAITTYVYDALNRVTSRAHKIGTTTDQTYTYSYDAGTFGKGRLTGAGGAGHTMSWVYDAQGRVTSKTQSIGTNTRTVQYGYTNGNLTSMTTPSGKVVTYGYANGRVTSVTVDGIVILNNALYDPFGPARQWTWGNGQLTVRTYDTDGKITQTDSGGFKTYGYDDAFRITSITDTVTAGNSWTALGYDNLDRLTSAVKTGTTIGHTYDANGNRLTQSGTASSTYTIAGTSNRLSTVTGALARTYTYDNSGAALTTGATIHTYYNSGRMKTGRLASTGTNTTYLHNALGQRIRKTGGTPGTVVFVYDEAGHLLGEYGSTGTLVQETIWLGDTPVATIRPKTGGYDIFYVHTDHLNQPRKITSNAAPPATPVVRWTFEPNPFGDGTPNENPAGAGAFKYHIRLPGQYFDIESNLAYNYYRDYDSAIGRYVESDPIGLEGGINTYAYAGDPNLFVDPLGLEAVNSVAQAGWGLPPPPPDPTSVLQQTYREMRDKNVRGTDQFFHCLAACRAKKAGSNPADIRLSLNSKEYLRDYPMGRLGIYGTSGRKSHQTMMDDIANDQAANERGLACPTDRSCNAQCGPLLDRLPARYRPFMQQYRTSW